MCLNLHCFHFDKFIPVDKRAWGYFFKGSIIDWVTHQFTLFFLIFIQHKKNTLKLDMSDWIAFASKWKISKYFKWGIVNTIRLSQRLKSINNHQTVALILIRYTYGVNAAICWWGDSLNIDFSFKLLILYGWNFFICIEKHIFWSDCCKLRIIK